jgi:tRNA(Ile)-lysidine synthase TilS/MesJ
MDWNMLREGDRVLLGLSGGKDSLALLHILHAVQKRSPIKWELAAVTVDPGTDAFDPSPLIPYVKSLGIPYFFLSERIIDRAKIQMQGNSICSFCSRMKRGSLYTCARKNGYNVLALGQHLDDLAESFIMSALHNGQLRTMKAHYTNDDGDIRIIRPMAYVRESQTKEFSYSAKLPIINENCPACFEGPKERHRVKKLLAQEANLFPGIFGNIKNAILPLMDEKLYHDMAAIRKKIQERNSGKKQKSSTIGSTDGSSSISSSNSSSSSSSNISNNSNIRNNSSSSNTR